MTETTEAPRPGACVIMGYSVSTPSGGAKAEFRCLTHEWQFGAGAINPDRCPLGRIEEATEAAIAKIAAKAEEYSRQQIDQEDLARAAMLKWESGRT